MRPITELLVANRGEIALRVIRGARELGISTVAVFADQDRMSRHRFAADRAFQVGAGGPPIAGYLDVDEIVGVALRSGADAIHPGYGFLAERPDLADAAAAVGITVVGPGGPALRALGDKVAARALAHRAGVPVVAASDPLGPDPSDWVEAAEQIGYPLLCKASWGGGGRGMRVVRSARELIDKVTEARREARTAFGNDAAYLERYVERARHVEVQVLGDRHGTIVHLHERDCSVQRRHQKVIEVAPAAYLRPDQRAEVCRLAVALVREVGYVGAGTVEFLYDEAREDFSFIEVNPRIQVEHTVTEAVTGIDIVRAQLGIAQDGRIGRLDETGVPPQDDIDGRGFALQCRITTEDPAKGFAPGSGTITSHRSAAGPGVRVDAGTAYPGALVTNHYDSLIEKLTVWAPSRAAAIGRARRALGETVIAGVPTNLRFLAAVIDHPTFEQDEVTTTFVDDHPELAEAPDPDPVTPLLDYLSWVSLNGHPDLRGRSELSLHLARSARPPEPLASCGAPGRAPDRPGTKQLLDELGPTRFARWMREQRRVLVTDTTLRDAHQSLLATRLRTADVLAAAPAMADRLPGLLSLECWGGATFDVAMRFLDEDPWDRLVRLREAVPDLALQMLIRGANAVGYTSYPDDVVRHVIAEAAGAGIDIFRVFDSLNLVDNMRVAIDAVLETGAVCEGAICYSGDLSDPDRPRHSLASYLDLARSLEAAGCHIIAIKDMAGVCRPQAARTLVTALRETVGVPVQFHTHDTSGFAGASVLAAVEAGVDAVDAAIDAMSGLTSQPALGSLVRCLERTDRETGLDPLAVAELSNWWEATRRLYAPFESDMRSGTGDVYRHEMPGGQHTNLREQARGLGIDDDRWGEVADAYTAVNRLFGDIPKVTPTSKVVGDLALLMVRGGFTEHDVVDPDTPVPFPESVVGLFRGDLGVPDGGFPEALSTKVLGARAVRRARAGTELPPADLDHDGTPRSARDLAARLMYPSVHADLQRSRARWGDLSVLPTHLYHFGLGPGTTAEILLADGRVVALGCEGITEPAADGTVRFLYRVDGEPRLVQARPDAIEDDRSGERVERRPKADPSEPGHVAAPFDAVIAAVAVQAGDRVDAGAALCMVEAMKMQTTILTETAGVVSDVRMAIGEPVEAGDLLATIDPTG